MKISRPALLASALLLAACQQKPASDNAAPAAAAANDPAAAVVATVNGTDITRGKFDFFVQAATGKPSAELTPEERNEALDALVRLQLIADQAVKDGVDKQPEVANVLAMSRMEYLQRGLQQKYLQDKQPTEAELRAEYETQISQMSKTEYRARHILVQTEQFANELLAQIKRGARFEQVAQKNSLDASKQQGGDLGWFAPQSMVKPFADAVMGLQKGQLTEKPVQTQYGWHIIRLDDTREVQPPPFEQVKPQLQNVVLAKKFRAYQDELLKTAKVEKKL